MLLRNHWKHGLWIWVQMQWISWRWVGASALWCKCIETYDYGSTPLQWDRIIVLFY